MRFFSLLLPLLIALSCKNSQQVADSAGTPVAWEKLEAGTSSGIETESYQLIQDPKAWSVFWTQLTSNRYPEPSVPTVDFERYSLVACLMGMRPNGGFAISILNLAEKEGELLLEVEHQGPGKGCFMTDALTQPYYLAKIPHTSLPLTVKTTSRQVDCE